MGGGCYFAWQPADDSRPRRPGAGKTDAWMDRLEKWLGYLETSASVEMLDIDHGALEADYREVLKCLAELGYCIESEGLNERDTTNRTS